jgi:hypothetical protein
MNNEQEQLDNAWAKIESGLRQEGEGRKSWIEGTLSLIQILDKGRKDRNDWEFSNWLKDMGYGENRIAAKERQALLNMALDLKITREVLEKTNRRSWQNIWREEVRPLALCITREITGTPIPIEQVTRFPDRALEIKKHYEQAAKYEQEQLQQKQRAVIQQEQRTEKRRERAKEIIQQNGWEVTWEFQEAEPVGRMPDDIRERYTEVVQAILEKMDELRELGEYREQMHPDLRHVLVEGPKTIKMLAERLAKEMIGGDGDLRKVKRFLCDEEIPLRVDET